jgi:nitrogen-specific signal transduction histidine kinase
MNKDVRIELACEPATPPVTGDPDRLQRTMWNLLTDDYASGRPDWVAVSRRARAVGAC